MATAQQLGFGTDKTRNVALIRTHNLSVEPNASWFRELGEAYQENDGTPMRMGKFVAIRSVLLFAPFPRVIIHREIRDARNDLSDVIQKELVFAQQENMNMLSVPYDHFSQPVTDAGFFMLDRTRGQESVLLSGESTDYGRGDTITRARTVGFLRASMAADGMHADQLGL